jgi:hypothetical protein
MCRPSTRVRAESKIADAGLPVMSDDTSASSEYSRIPASGPSAATRYAVSTSSRVTSRDTVVLSSTIEPTGTGTRIESPDSLPARFGSTRPIALAAPVVVGTMFTPAARARRGSRCGPSCRFCSWV